MTDPAEFLSRKAEEIRALATIGVGRFYDSVSVFLRSDPRSAARLGGRFGGTTTDPTEWASIGGAAASA
jgi:hypothetical protein